MDIGGELRAARHARKLSIEDISRATKIAPPLLRAIENDAFDDIPGGLFTRGFLRAYAREVGLDAEDLVQRYRSRFEPSIAAVDATEGPEPPSPTVEPLDADEASGGSTAAHILQVCVIVIIAVGYLASLRSSKPTALLPSARPDAIVAPAAAVVPVGTTGTTEGTAAALTIELQPHGPCWVDAAADGAHVVARLMNAGDRQTLKVSDALTLRIGDPAAFGFSIDGVPGRSLGREGVPATVRINRRNYESFLDSGRRREPTTASRRPEADVVPAAACCGAGR